MTPREQAINIERLDWMEKAVNAEVALRDLMAYLQTPKFHGDGDFVHVSTDLYPKLREIYNSLAMPVTHWSTNAN